MEVQWWKFEDPTRPAWNGAVMSDPEINNTDRPFETMQNNIVAAYNQKNGTAYEVDDFTWTEVPMPQG